MGSGTYSTTALNVIYAEWCGGTRVEYWIVQPAQMSNRYRSILSLGSSTPPLSNVNSFSFDGIDEIFQGSSIYQELNGGTKLTVSVWVKPISGAPILEYLISNPRNATANEHQFALTLYENNNVQLDVQGHNSKYVLGDINAVTYGQWNHILACVDLDRTVGLSLIHI